MRRHIVLLGWIAWGLAACGGSDTTSGSGGGGSGGGGGGSGTTSTVTTPPDLVAACLKVCDKAYNPSCLNITLDQCTSACPNLASEIDPLCLDIGTQFYQCSAEYEYTCGENGPMPVIGTGPECLDVIQAYSDCEDQAPCKHYCAAANECDGTSVDPCVQGCLNLSDFSSNDCASEFTELLDCQNKGNLECSGGKLVSPACGEQQKQLNNCLGIVPPFCDTYCEAPGTGCAPDFGTCQSACEAEVSAASNLGCSDAFVALRTCQSTGTLQCEGGAPSIANCSEEAFNYNTCMGIAP